MNELDTLTRLATLGTSRAPELVSEAGGLEGTVLRALEALPVERRLLLAAGARAVATTAGRKLPRREPRGDAAPPDTLPVCPPRVSAVLLGLIQEKDEALLREAFTLLARAGRRLPPELLPRVLGLPERSLYAAAEPVLGERGRWLARQNPGWRLTATPTGRDAAEAERVWTEGKPEERRAALTHTRASDPARARDWLQATWTQEKAELRAGFLACLEVGLSPEDEPLLELGRKDRAASVREVARRLLARLPGSAFVRRMGERARAVVTREKGAELRLQLPTKWDAEAERDGLDKPPPGASQSEHWLVRLLEHLPLGDWESRFEASPEALLAAAARTEHGVALSMGWARALRLGAESDWASALLGFWSGCEAKVLSSERAQSLALSVFEQLEPTERAGRALRLLRGTGRLPSLASALEATPAPWPEELGRAWLQTLRGIAALNVKTEAVLDSLHHAALALPEACLATAAEPFEIPRALSPWRAALDRFQQTVSLRRILYEELKP
ncbi:MAG TPA: DUF5691 domain-containing protein [Myxococcaceae bacterium]|nr:DUF5691 domain-containing protein [Myxococcaceae bacterium]